jgi:hypothetical protein
VSWKDDKTEEIGVIMTPCLLLLTCNSSPVPSSCFLYSFYIYILDMPPTTRHWTSALLQVLAPFCLSAKFPWQLAFVVPALFIVDLYRRSQRPRREAIRSVVGQEKRKVRRLNGRDGTVLLREEVSSISSFEQQSYWLTQRLSTKQDPDGDTLLS